MLVLGTDEPTWTYKDSHLHKVPRCLENFILLSIAPKDLEIPLSLHTVYVSSFGTYILYFCLILRLYLGSNTTSTRNFTEAEVL